jgi:hypothetical protein
MEYSRRYGKRNYYKSIIPFVENENEIFLKTIYPSRKATQKYLNKDKLHEET